MSDILWTSWQVQHIEKKHGVSATDFEEAWDDPTREDPAEEEDPDHGPYYRSIGITAAGRLLEMLWRWQQEPGDEEEAVWPITAYFRGHSEESSHRPKIRPKEQT